MAIDEKTVYRIAQLARIHVDQNEVHKYAVELSSILAFVEQMAQIETDDVPPLSHPRDLTLRLREDEVTETDQRETFQAIAPNVDAGHYLVPRVIE